MWTCGKAIRHKLDFVFNLFPVSSRCNPLSLVFFFCHLWTRLLVISVCCGLCSWVSWSDSCFSIYSDQNRMLNTISSDAPHPLFIVPTKQSYKPTTMDPPNPAHPSYPHPVSDASRNTDLVMNLGFVIKPKWSRSRRGTGE